MNLLIFKIFFLCFDFYLKIDSGSTNDLENESKPSRQFINRSRNKDLNGKEVKIKQIEKV